MRLCAIFIVFFSFSVLGEPLTVSQAAHLLVDKNSTLVRAKLEWDIRKLEKQNRYYKFFPSLVFQTQGGLDAKSQIGQSSPWTSQYTFTAAENIWSPDNNYWTYKEGDLSERFAELLYRQSRDTLLLTLVQRICDYLSYESQVAINTQELKWVEQEFNTIQHSYQQGLKPYSDFLRFKGRYYNAKLTVDNLETLRKQSLVEVAKLVEMEEPPSVVQGEMQTIDDETLPGKLFVDDVLEAQTEIGRVRTQIVRTRFPWELDVTAGANYSQTNYLQGMPWIRQEGPWESFGLVSFKWQLWDWGISSRIIQQERLRQDQAISDQELARTQTHGRLKQLDYDIVRLKRQLKMQGEIVRIELENLKQQTLNYRNGKSTFLDYSDALTNVGVAKQTFRDSELQLKRLRAEALSLKGRLYDQLVAQ
jgi:outer membrane protein TolC